MILVSVVKEKSSIKSLTITGHAFRGDPGYDLVCAAVSSMATGALNGLDQLSSGCTLYLDESPKIEIVCQSVNKVNQLLLEFLLVQLKTVEEVEKEAIKIEEEFQ